MDNLIFKLSIYNRVNNYQISLIQDINIFIKNEINKYDNIIIFNQSYNKYQKIFDNKKIINKDVNNILPYDKTNICILSNDNWTENEIKNMLKRYNNIFFIIDETNEKVYSCVDYINHYHNLLVIKKTYNNSYIVSNTKIIDNINKKIY